MRWRRTGLRLAMLAALGSAGTAAPGAPGSAPKAKAPTLDVPFLPTELLAVEEMLKLAKVTSKDYVFDLGCGDGRIVVTAAKRYKARGFGVDLDPKRVRESNENAKKAGVTDLVKFEEGNIMVTDIRQATVVTLFLLESVNVRLRPRLFAHLKPGVPVVSNGFHMRDWKPDKTVRHAKAYGGSIYLWIMPAPVGGTWRWKAAASGGGAEHSVALEQEFQAVKGTLSVPGAAGIPLAEASLAGKELRFVATVPVGGRRVRTAYQGTADGDVLRGTQKRLDGSATGTRPWVAKRDAVDLTGRWQVRAPSRRLYSGVLHIQRKADKLAATYVRDSDPKKTLPLPGFYVWGSSIRFEVSTGLVALAFSGSLGADTGGGAVAREQASKKATWSARRIKKK